MKAPAPGLAPPAILSPVILASQSPRRAEILRRAGIPFSVRPACLDETPRSGERPAEYVERLAQEKAAVVPAESNEIVLGADTTVVIDGEMLGKPADVADARRMLALLAGRRHEVMTGICLRRGDQCVSDTAVTEVWFALMSEEEIAAYAATGEPLDKAGAYAIQGLASKYIDKINGCYFNVVGLPISMVYAHLRYFTNNTELPRSL
jgi:septum formation protein